MNYFSKEENWERFKAILLSWIGTPYRHLAMVKGRGADCIMFVGGVWKEFGVFSKDLMPLLEIEYSYYSPDWYKHETDERILNGIIAHFKKFATNKVRAPQYKPDVPLYRGDLLIFSTNRKGISNHAGIYLGDKKMIHASCSRGVSIFGLSDTWKKRMKTFFRLEFNE